MTRPLALLLALLAAVAGACNDAKRDAEGQVQSSGDVSVYDLRPGDCFDGGPRPQPGERIVNVVTGVPCDQSHDNEVFAVFDHPSPDDALFPGEKEMTKVAEDGCVERFPGYVGRPYADSDLQVAVIAPGAQSWDGGDRAIVCIAYREGKRLKGSQKADGD
jgi:hypothetical protein